MKRPHILSVVSVALIAPILSSCSLFTVDVTLTGDTVTTETPIEYTTPNSYIGSESDPITFPSREFDADEIIGDFVEADYNGDIFLVLTVSDTDNPLFPSEGDDMFSLANSTIEYVSQKYNISIVNYKLSLDEAIDTFKNNTDSYLYTADLIIAPVEFYNAVKKGDYLISLTRTAFLDLEADYFDSTVRDLLGSSPEYTLAPSEFVSPYDEVCIYYNIAMLEAAKVTDPYKTAKEGNFTYQDLIGLSAAGNIATDIDLVKLVCASYGMSNYEINAAGGKYPVEISEMADDLSLALDGKLVTDSAKESFLAGESAVYIGTLADCEDLSQMTASWSLLPVPKMDTADSSYPSLNLSNECEQLWMIPAYCGSAERTAQIISVLCALGYKQAWYTEADAIESYLRVNRAIIMFNMIIDRE